MPHEEGLNVIRVSEDSVLKTGRVSALLWLAATSDPADPHMEIKNKYDSRDDGWELIGVQSCTGFIGIRRVPFQDTLNIMFVVLLWSHGTSRKGIVF